MHHLISVNLAKSTVKEDIRHLMSSLCQLVRLLGDNQAALSLVKDAYVNERSKHIDVAYHFVRKL